MATFTDLIVSREGDVAVITLNRPEKRNALRTETFADLAGAFQETLGDDTVRAIVLTGAGDRAFSAGLDLSQAPTGDDMVATVGRVQSLLNCVEEAGTPVIAALNGDAFGGGCELALACHLRVMDRRARVGQTESHFGIMPAAGGTQRLVRVVGLARALELLLFAKKVEAEEAYRIGLVHRLSEAGRALEDAMVLARDLARRPPLAVRGTIQAIFRGLNQGSLAEGLAAERENVARCAMSEDAMEGITAFLQKREPEFRGK